MLQVLLAVVTVGSAAPRPTMVAGSFTRLVGVDSNGTSVEIRLTSSGPQSDASLFAGRSQGPRARERPRRFTLGRRGVYSGGLLHPLDRGVWAFADANRGPAAANTRGLSVRTTSQLHPLYGIVGPAPAGIVRIDLRTLRPTGGRRLPLAGHGTGWSFSPDRSRIVLGATVSQAELRFVDLRRMRVLGDVEIAREGSVFATAWAGPSRVLAVVLTPGCCGLGDTSSAEELVERGGVLHECPEGGDLPLAVERE